MNDITTEFIPDNPFEKYPIRSNIINDLTPHINIPRCTEPIENYSRVDIRTGSMQIPASKYLSSFPIKIFFALIRIFRGEMITAKSAKKREVFERCFFTSASARCA